jgi:hypothetical protein
MPNFKENTSPAMKRSGFKMKGYTYPGTSPVRKETDWSKVYADANKPDSGATEEQKAKILQHAKNQQDAKNLDLSKMKTTKKGKENIEKFRTGKEVLNS